MAHELGHSGLELHSSNMSGAALGFFVRRNFGEDEIICSYYGRMLDGNIITGSRRPVYGESMMVVHCSNFLNCGLEVKQATSLFQLFWIYLAPFCSIRLFKDARYTDRSQVGLLLLNNGQIRETTDGKINELIHNVNKGGRTTLHGKFEIGRAHV